MTFMLRQESQLNRIKELRAELNQFTDPSEIFIKAIKQKCENEGIDPHIVICSDEHFEVICKKGNVEEFKS